MGSPGESFLGARFVRIPSVAFAILMLSGALTPASADDCLCESINCDCTYFDGSGLIAGGQREICLDRQAYLRRQCKQAPDSFRETCTGDWHGPSAWPTDDNRTETPPECGWSWFTATLLGLGIAALVSLAVLTGVGVLAGGGVTLVGILATVKTGVFWSSTIAGGAAVLVKSLSSPTSITTGELVYEATVVSASAVLGGKLLNGEWVKALFRDLGSKVIQGAVSGLVVSTFRGFFDATIGGKSPGRVAVDIGIGTLFGGAIGHVSAPNPTDSLLLSEFGNQVAGIGAAFVSNIVDLVIALLEWVRR